MRATLLDLIAGGRLQILIEPDWHPSEPGTHVWLSFDGELIHSIPLSEDDTDESHN